MECHVKNIGKVHSSKTALTSGTLTPCPQCSKNGEDVYHLDVTALGIVYPMTFSAVIQT